MSYLSVDLLSQLIAEALSRSQDRTLPLHKIHEYIYTGRRFNVVGMLRFC